MQPHYYSVIKISFFNSISPHLDLMSGVFLFITIETYTHLYYIYKKTNNENNNESKTKNDL
jgi:hypothetical protein